MTSALPRCSYILSNKKQCRTDSDKRYQNGFRDIHHGPVCAQHFQLLFRENTKHCKLKGCRTEVKSKAGYCRPHEHVPLNNLEPWQREHIWAKIASQVEGDPVTGCWNFIGPLWDQDYAHIQAGHGVGPWLGHRLTYHLVYAGHGNKLQLDHLCNNTICLNPLHLNPVTSKDNNRLRSRRALDPKSPWHLHAEYRRITIQLLWFAGLHGLPLRPWRERVNEDGSIDHLSTYEMPYQFKNS